MKSCGRPPAPPDRGGGKDLGAHDVAVMMALVKIGRIGSGVVVRDNYVDAVAYIGLADRLAT